MIAIGITMESIRAFLEGSTRAGRLFNLSIYALIIMSLISFTIETLPDISAGLTHILKIFEICTIAIFTVEYLLRVISVERKLKYIFSFYGVIDLLAILPFYLQTGVDLRSIRIFRMFRLVRAFKMLRYGSAIEKFKSAFLMVKEELILFLVATVFLLFVSAVGIYYFENAVQPEQFKSVFHSLWWAVATLTTVGYGDIYPVTVGGKVFTSIIVLVGIGIIAVPTGLIASAMSQVVKPESWEKEK